MTDGKLARIAFSPLVFGTSVVAIYGAAWFIIRRLATWEEPALMAVAVTLDLAVVVPGLYYALMVRGRGWPTISVVPVFFVSLLAARALVPEAYHTAADALGWLVAPLELTLIGFLGYKAVRLTRRMRTAQTDHGDLDFYDRFRAVAVETLGHRRVAEVLAFEAGLLYYAVAGWFTAPPGGGFTVYRRTGYGAVLAGVMMAATVELVGVHLLVQQWSPAAAWGLTALSLYSILWLLGDYQAMRHRPIRFGPDGLELRLGIRWTVRVPYDAIASVFPYAAASSAASSAKSGTTNAAKKRTLKAVAFGEPRYTLRLARPLEAVGPYGLRKTVVRVDFSVDEAERFEAALRAGYAAWDARA